MGIDQRTFTLDNESVIQSPTTARILEAEKEFRVNNITKAKMSMTVDMSLLDNNGALQDQPTVVVLVEKTTEWPKDLISTYRVEQQFTDVYQVEEWLYKLAPTILTSLFTREKIPNKEVDRTIFYFVDQFQSLKSSLADQEECRKTLLASIEANTIKQR